jgi:hypothetical protein
MGQYIYGGEIGIPEMKLKKYGNCLISLSEMK